MDDSFRVYFFGHFISKCMKHRIFCLFFSSTGLVLRCKNVLFRMERNLKGESRLRGTQDTCKLWRSKYNCKIL